MTTLTCADVEMDQVVDDTAAWPIITHLTECLCRQVALAGLGSMCICSPMPGAGVAADYVEDGQGMAWVRLAGAYPSVAFPTLDETGVCWSPLAIALEVGVLLCAPVIGERGELPGVVDQMQTTRLQMAALAAMRKAVQCCFPASARDVVLGAYAPVGPEGGVVGGAWTVFVAEGAVMV